MLFKLWEGHKAQHAFSFRNKVTSWLPLCGVFLDSSSGSHAGISWQHHEGPWLVQCMVWVTPSMMGFTLVAPGCISVISLLSHLREQQKAERVPLLRSCFAGRQARTVVQEGK